MFIAIPRVISKRGNVHSNHVIAGAAAMPVVSEDFKLICPSVVSVTGLVHAHTSARLDLFPAIRVKQPGAPFRAFGPDGFNINLMLMPDGDRPAERGLLEVPVPPPAPNIGWFPLPLQGTVHLGVGEYEVHMMVLGNGPGLVNGCSLQITICPEADFIAALCNSI
jgi:hypothetical protein